MIDAHFHLFPPMPSSHFGCVRGQDGLDLPDLPGFLVSQGLDHIVAFGLPHEEVSVQQANRFVLEAARLCPQQVTPVGILDPEVDRWVELGVRGFKEHVYGQRRFRGGPGVKYASAKQWAEEYRAVERAQLPLIVHFGPNVVERIQEIKNLAPGLVLVAAHLGWHYQQKPDLGDLCDFLVSLREVPGLFFDLACFGTREADIFRWVCDHLGSNRLLFGSDYPTDLELGWTPLRAFQELKALGLPKGDWENLVKGTAEQVFRIGSGLSNTP